MKAEPRRERMQWDIPVVDPHGRTRMLMIVVSEGNVVMLGPPGEAWVVPPTSDLLLREALMAARRVVVEAQAGRGS